MPSDVPANQAERIPAGGSTGPAQHQPAPEQSPPDPAAGRSPAVTLMSAHIARSSPAWSRLSERSQEKLNTLAHSPEPLMATVPTVGGDCGSSPAR
jgi:hypothetical protein